MIKWVCVQQLEAEMVMKKSWWESQSFYNTNKNTGELLVYFLSHLS